MLFVARGTAVGIVGRLAARLLLLVLSPVVARIMGASGLGLIGLGITTLLVGSTIASMGIPTGIVRYLPIYLQRYGTEKAVALAARATLAGLFLGLIAGAGLWTLAPWLAVVLRKPEATLVVRVIAFAMPFGVLRLSLSAIAIARHNAVYQNLSDITRLCVTFLFVIVGAWFLHLGLHGAIWGIAFGEIAAVIPALIGVPRVLGISIRVFLHSLRQAINLGEFIFFSFTVALIQLTQLGIYHINLVLGARWLDHTNLGIYTATAELATAATVGLVAVGDIFRPSAAALHDRQATKEMESVFHGATRWVYYLTMPALVFMFVRAEDLLSIFGPDFRMGVLALRILCLGQIINAGTGNVGHLLVMAGYQWLNLFDNTAMMMLNVALCLGLAPSLGIVGVAVAASVATAMVNLLRAAQVYWYLHVSPFHWDAFKVFLAACIGALALLVPIDGLALRLASGALLYAVAFLLALWLLSPPAEDKIILRQFLARKKTPSQSVPEAPQPSQPDAEARN
ncbi:MAG: oligosaccharide flippase family protein [Armatimonadetes bacterium]|nr:oligosaccharide flippase family protein [Armatimonadota bacterium]